jgi:TolA-binding protein
MNDPVRLRDGAGPARTLMRGAELAVPRAARARALAFTASAASMTAGGTALAASGGALAKSIVLYVSLGVVGGGLASFGVSRALHPVDQPPSAALATSPAVRKSPPLLEASPSPSSDVGEPAVEARAAPTDSAPAASAAREVATPRVTRAEPSSAPARRSLLDEQRVIESARAAITRGDAATGLKLLNDYERGFPQGQFHPEALALRVEALAGRGEGERARTLASEFARRYPQHPLLARVRASAGAR